MSDGVRPATYELMAKSPRLETLPLNWLFFFETGMGVGFPLDLQSREGVPRLSQHDMQSMFGDGTVDVYSKCKLTRHSLLMSPAILVQGLPPLWMSLGNLDMSVLSSLRT